LYKKTIIILLEFSSAIVSVDNLLVDIYYFYEETVYYIWLIFVIKLN